VICSVTKQGEHGESGSHIIRLLSGKLFNEKIIFPIDQKKLDTIQGKIILIVDDFLGSGLQFSRFATSSALINAAKKNNIIYAPSMAYYKGLDATKKKSYGIELMPLETVFSNEQFFTFKRGATFCGDEVNTEENAIKVYEEMRALDSKFIKSKSWYGRDSASLCVGFQWGCPNQSLGVTWLDGSNDWQKLQRRRGAE
jgi:hypothetical protein